MHSVAGDRPELFERTSNPQRCHSLTESKELDVALLRAWQESAVPVAVVPTSSDFACMTAATCSHHGILYCLLYTSDAADEL